MGSVWRAEHVELASLCAIKLIDDDLAESVAVRTRFRREAKAAAALSSDHVVRTFDYGVDGGTPYIVMELLTGESLDQRLRRLGRLSPEQLFNVLSQVALALDRAHKRGLIHRDLKPGNLFICQTDTGEDCIKLLDFGIAKSLRSDDDLGVGPTRTGALIGSPAYMSPEQLRNVGGVDQTSDIWSLGVVAYEALVGQRPFNAQTMADLTVSICVAPLPVPSDFSQVPLGFDAWFATACNRDTRARFASVGALVQAFKRLLPCPELSLSPVTSIASPISSSPNTRHESPAMGAQDHDRSDAQQSQFTTSHPRSTGPLSRTAIESIPRRSSRNYWWMAGVGAALVAAVMFRKGPPGSSMPASSHDAQASEAPLASAHQPLRALHEQNDAGVPTVNIDPQGVRNALQDRSPRSLRGPHASAPLTSAHGGALAAPSATSRGFVPDSVYGF